MATTQLWAGGEPKSSTLEITADHCNLRSLDLTLKKISDRRLTFPH